MNSIEVHIAAESPLLPAGLPSLVGHAFFTHTRDSVSTNFIYDAAYLASGGPNIDPHLRLMSGSQYFPRLLGSFADAAPDRWGRNLLDKAERSQAAKEGRLPRRLNDIDYLLGVSDNTRQGALRFRLGGGTFRGRPSTVPPLVSLPHLMRLSESVVSDANPHAAVKELLDTGTTGLGGARPKASVILDDGALGIAKFPHASDEWDVLAWEAVALRTLRDCGVWVSDFKLVRVEDRGVLLTRRFDRDATGARLPYFSAMTAVGGQDGSHYDYADVADAIRDISCRPAQDLAALFDRVVLYVALGNTDDHLRNHGFVWTGDGWRLSPAFDVNPTPFAEKRRSTSILGADAIDSEAPALLDFADLCGLSHFQAEARVAELVRESAVCEKHARAYGVRSKEIAMMGEMLEIRRNALLEPIQPHA